MTDLSLHTIGDLTLQGTDDEEDDDDPEAIDEKCLPTRPPEYYLANEEVLNSSGTLQTEYSEATTSMLDTIEQQWVQYVSTKCLDTTE
jgi:hypothetical protein